MYEKEFALAYAKKQIELINEVLLQCLTAAQRKDLFDILRAGYCSDCGSDRCPCHCMNDD